MEGMVGTSIDRRGKKKSFSAVRRIAISFIVVILIGSILLYLPISNQNEAGSYINHLFTAVSATCVTGLVPFCVADQYTIVGQVIILLLIQIGGLGFLTLLNVMLIFMKRRLSYQNKLVLKEALNINSIQSMTTYIKRVIKYTAFFELLGTILLSIAFIPEYGAIKGVYYGLFHAVSAFCNAGFDILGSQSLIPYQSNVLVNLVICGLIIAGGLGFVVWIDIGQALDKYMHSKNKHLSNVLSMHTRIVLMMTSILLIAGTVGFFCLEYNNTLQGFDITTKWLISFFQSTTYRTAGFATISIEALKDSTKIFSIIFMFIGGSPAGTAGGIKTTTFMIVLCNIYTLSLGHNHVSLLNRTLSDQTVKKALTISILSFFITVLGLFILSITETGNFIDLTFEVYSAFGTVGLSANITTTLTNIGKLVIMLLMYIGRIGPITMLLTFTSRYNQNNRKEFTYPEGEVLIG